MGNKLKKQQKQEVPGGIQTERTKEAQKELNGQTNIRHLLEENKAISAERNRMEEEVAAHPNIFKKGYQWGQGARLRELRRKDSMGNLVRVMTTDMEQRLKENASREPEAVNEAFVNCLNLHVPETKISPERLLREQAKPPQEFPELCEIWHDLGQFTAKTLTPEKARSLMEKYVSLKLSHGEATSARYLREKNAYDPAYGIHLLEQDPASCHMLLYQCVSEAMQNLLNFEDRSQVDEAQFAILCAVAKTATQAATSVCVGKTFLDRREARKEELLTRQKEQEANRRSVVDALKLEEWIRESAGTHAWFENAYEPCLKKALSAMIREGENGEERDETRLRQEAVRVMERLNEQLTAIESYFNIHPEYHLGMPRLKDKLCAEAGKLLDLEAIGHQVHVVMTGEADEQEDFTGQQVEKLISEHPELVNVACYRERKEAFAKKIPAMPQEKLQEIWQNEEFQNLILYTESQEEFKKRISAAAEQAEVNEEHLLACVEKKLLTCSRKKAAAALKNWFGTRLLTVYPALIEYYASQFLEHLNVTAPEIHKLEQGMRRALRETGFPVQYEDSAQHYLQKQQVDLENAEAVKAGLLSCRKALQKNMELFTRTLEIKKFTKEGWRVLSDWKDENLFAQYDSFEQELKEQTQKAQTLEKSEKKIGWNAWFYGQAEAKLKSTHVTYADRLKQEDLCNWDGFNGLFATEENSSLLMEAVGELLKQGTLSKTFPFLKGIDNLEGLENLRMEEYRRFSLFLRVNLSKTAEQWENLRSETGLTIQKNLLSRMLSGKIADAEQFRSAVFWENDKLQNKKRTEEQWTEYLLGTVEERTGTMQYNYFFVTTKKKERMEERVRHFRNVAVVWDKLYEKLNSEQIQNVLELNEWLLQHYDQQNRYLTIDRYLWYTIRNLSWTDTGKNPGGVGIMKIWLEKQGVPEESDKFKKFVNAAKEIVPAFAPIWSKSGVTEVEEAEDVRRDTYLEFLMCGMEEAIYQPGKKYQMEFGAEDKKYLEGLQEKAITMVRRSHYVEKIIQSVCTHGETKEEIQKLRSHLKMIAGGLEQQNGSSDTAEENRRRYGVENMAALSVAVGKCAQKGPVLEFLRESEAVKYGRERKAQMEVYENGIFRGLVPVLMENHKVWTHIMQDEDEAFVHYLAGLRERLAPLLKLLNEGVYREHTSSVSVFARMHADDLLQPHSDPDYWKKELEKFASLVLQQESGGKTLEDNLKQLEKTYGSVLCMRILIAVLRNTNAENEKDLSALFKARKLNSVLKKGKASYDSNMAFMNRQLKITGEAETFTAPFIQYMTEDCIRLEPKQFAKSYQELYQDYCAQLKQVEENEPVFDDSSLIRLKENRVAVAQKVQSGIDAEKIWRYQLDILRRQIHRVGSPILAQAGAKEIPAEKEIKKAEELAEITWDEAPELVQELMAEEILAEKVLELSGEERKEQLEKLGKKEVWLEQQYHKLKTANEEAALPAVELERRMLFLSIHGEGDTAKLISRYEGRRKQLSELENLKNATTFSFLRHEIQDTEACLNMGLYTMEDKAFQELCENRKHYFASAERACRVIQSETAKVKKQGGYQWLEGSMEAGLREYFRLEILSGIGAAEEAKFQEQVRDCLSREEWHSAIADSGTGLGSISFDDLKPEERQGTAVDRKKLEVLIAGCGKKKVLEQYNALDLEQRQLFARVLTLPGEFSAGEKLAGSRIAHRMDETNGGISYAAAIEKLSLPDGSFNEDVFAQAMEFTQLCMEQQRQRRPKDWARMNDGITSLGRVLLMTEDETKKAALTGLMKQQVNSPEHFLELLKAFAQKDGQKKMLAELEKMDANRAKLLITLLQRRSVLDHSTAETRQMLHYADARGRAELLEQLKGEEREGLLREAAGSAASTQAFRSLCSYQLRDDVDLTGRFLEKADFAKKALKQETMLDWTLFQQALSVEEELNRDWTKIQALRQAPLLIEKSGHKPAIDAYQSYKAKQSMTQEEFDGFIREQAEADLEKRKDVPALVAGYYALDENQKRLFMRALLNRDVLDVSKENYMASYLGLSGRDYVNPQERDQIANEYLRLSLSGSRIWLPEGYEKRALMSLLSRQLDDSRNYADPECLLHDEKAVDNMMGHRTTAVDWKLFSRALQFVNRTSSEARIMAQDRELYVSRGDLKEQGAFHFEGEYLRKNLHSAGSRASHFLGRMFVKTVQEKVPAYSHLLQMTAGFSDRAAGLIDAYGLAAEEEESSILAKTAEVHDTLGSVAEKLGDQENRKYLEYVLSKQVSAQVQNRAGSLAEPAGYVGTALKAFEAIGNLAQTVSNAGKLKQAEEAGARKRRFDQEDADAAAAYQTKTQKETGEQGLARNERGMNAARHMTRHEQYRQAAGALKEIAEALTEQFGGANAEIYTAIAEKAVECAYCVQQFFVDRKLVDQYFDLKKDSAENPQIEKLKEAYKQSGLSEKGMKHLEDFSGRELYQKAMGYESFDELAAQAGFEVIRSILYSAGPYNPVRENRICASMVLYVLGFTQLIGRQDSEAAMMLYQKLAGTQYK